MRGVPSANEPRRLSRGTSASDPTTIATTYQSSHNISIPSDQIDDDNPAIRAFGWIRTFPAISQRVANDTAHTLSEIDERFPAN